MLNSKFDINSPEWIDRVFENRNKSYGAYDLRKHYAGNLSRALAITIFSLAAVFGISAYVMKDKPKSVAINKNVDVNNKVIKVTAPDKDKSKNTPALKIGELDIKPLPVGGATAWARFLEDNLRYPAEAKAKRISGSVILSFIVERDGSLSNIHIDQTAGYGFDQEALRVVNLSPAWVAGKQNGQTVRLKYSLPINFTIQHK
ncbi:MAG: energy transducer TonB [Mucilaginibacter sp.]|uniref:energy transducer TonB n=1 Tax=Mucilaginibacter sp. TaxID=1882438 RepID=UPI0032663F60